MTGDAEVLEGAGGDGGLGGHGGGGGGGPAIGLVRTGTAQYKGGIVFAPGIGGGGGTLGGPGATDGQAGLQADQRP